MDSFSGSVGWRRWVRRGRRVALAVAGLWCVVLGIGITGAMVAGGTLGQVGTPTLLGVVGMMVLPGLTALALRLDSRERRRMPARLPGEAGRVAHPAHLHEGARRGASVRRARGRSGERVG